MDKTLVYEASIGGSIPPAGTAVTAFAVPLSEQYE